MDIQSCLLFYRVVFGIVLVVFGGAAIYGAWSYFRYREGFRGFSVVMSLIAVIGGIFLSVLIHKRATGFLCAVMDGEDVRVVAVRKYSEGGFVYKTDVTFETVKSGQRIATSFALDQIGSSVKIGDFIDNASVKGSKGKPALLWQSMKEAGQKQ